MKLNMEREPFSVYGAYSSLNYITPARWGAGQEEGLYYRDAARWSTESVAKIECVEDGVAILPTMHLEPGYLRLSGKSGFVEVTYSGCTVMRFRGEGMQLRFCFFEEKAGNIMPYNENTWYIRQPQKRIQMIVSAQAGKLDTGDDWNYGKRAACALVKTCGQAWEFFIEQFEGAWVPITKLPPFEQCIFYWKLQFEDFYSGYSPVPEQYREADKAAAYVNWMSTVRAGGLLQRDSILMSKNWMTCVWTWDCCFNAMALAEAHPALAAEQLCLPFDGQKADTGILPDTTSYADRIYEYTKPPVHGWTLKYLMERGAVTEKQLTWLLPRLEKWTDYWFTYADWDHDGMCNYTHGNDSGWDNCSGYQVGCPIEGPELAAYLVIQMDVLADIYQSRGNPGKAAYWRKRADAQLKGMIDHFWNGTAFEILQSGTHRKTENADSLYAFVPLILGKRLPNQIFAQLVAGLKEEGRFLTPFGLATESKQSPYFVDDGYWLGPIWAPPMYQIIRGLCEGGEKDFALELARRFCNMVVASGFAENFSAQDGRGLRDPAYTWTSSVFQMLARL